MLTLFPRLFGALLAVTAILMTQPLGETAEAEHPEWCDPDECKTIGTGTEHRSAYLEIDRAGREVTEVQSQMTRSTTGNGVTTVIVAGFTEVFEPGEPDDFEQALILSLRQADILARHLAQLVRAAGGPNDPARGDVSATEV